MEKVKSKGKVIKTKMIKLWRIGVGDNYEVVWTDGLIVGQMVQKEVHTTPHDHPYMEIKD